MDWNHWHSLADFLAMGGYASYVWGSLGMTIVLMTLEPMLLLRRRSKLLARLRQQLQAQHLQAEQSQRSTN